MNNITEIHEDTFLPLNSIKDLWVIFLELLKRQYTKNFSWKMIRFKLFFQHASRKLPVYQLKWTLKTAYRKYLHEFS